jgi:hypothetical protein
VRHITFLLVVAAPAALLIASCSSPSTAPPLTDCPTCTFRPGKIIITGDAGKDSGTPADSGTPDSGTPDSGAPDSGAPSDSGAANDGADGAP